MNVKYVLVAFVVTTQLGSVLCFPWLVLPAVAALTGSLARVAHVAIPDKAHYVEVHNEGKHHAHLYCESKDDKIGGREGIWVKPGDKLAWGFGRRRNTQFWCNMDWYGQRVGWDVFVGNWKDAPNPTKWSIRNDGVYDQWQNRKWRNLNS